jgi:hypothetical protein
MSSRIAPVVMVLALGAACSDGRDPELRRELLGMQQADQGERACEAGGVWNDADRAERLQEIIDEQS